MSLPVQIAVAYGAAALFYLVSEFSASEEDVTLLGDIPLLPRLLLCGAWLAVCLIVAGRYTRAAGWRAGLAFLIVNGAAPLTMFVGVLMIESHAV